MVDASATQSLARHPNFLDSETDENNIYRDACSVTRMNVSCKQLPWLSLAST